MTTRNFLNLGLALALAVLIALVIYDPGKEPPVSKTFLTPLKPADIQKLVIEQTKRGDTTEPKVLIKTVLTKKNDQWQMIIPYNNLANTLRINKLLKLSHATSHAQYSATEINLKQLKLSSPDLTVSLNDTKLFFGTTDALKGYRYIQIKNTVHLITDRFSHLVRGQATTLLNPALLPKNFVITRLVLPELTLQANEMGWKASPNNKSFSADQLQQLIDEWRFARALRVSKITTTTDDKGPSIVVYNDKNQRFSFNLTHTKDEIILSRTDIGLRYHFAAEAGDRLFKPQPSKSSSTSSN